MFKTLHKSADTREPELIHTVWYSTNKMAAQGEHNKATQFMTHHTHWDLPDLLPHPAVSLAGGVRPLVAEGSDHCCPDRLQENITCCHVSRSYTDLLISWP